MSLGESHLIILIIMDLCDDCSERRRMKDALNFQLMYVLDLIQRHLEPPSNTQED